MGNDNKEKTTEVKKAKRLFVAEYESAKEWTCEKRSILSHINDGDFYLIFKSGKGVFPSPTCQDIINGMGEYKELVMDCEILNDDDYKVYILQKIREYSDSNTFVYFLSMEQIYLELKGDLIDEVADVQNNRNWNVGRKRVKSKTKTVMSIKKGEKQTDNSDLFESSISMVISPNINTPKTGADDNTEHNHSSENEENTYKEKPKSGDIEDINPNPLNLDKDESSMLDMTKESGKEVKGKEEDNKKSGFTFSPEKVKRPEPPQEKPKIEKDKKSDEPIDFGAVFNDDSIEKIKNSNTTSQNNSHKMQDDDIKPKKPSSGIKGTPLGQKTPLGQGGRTQGGRMQGGRMQGKPTPQPSDDTTSRRELEKMIFTGSQENALLDKEFDDTDIGRADFIYMTSNKIIKDIETFCKKVLDYDFNHAQYIKIITTLAKSQSYMDFMQSWDVLEPGKPLGMDERVYNLLYGKAREFAKLCEDIYEKSAIFNT